LLALLVAVPALAAPTPPGGHHPVHYGGDNRGGYPNLHQPAAVAPTDVELRALRVNASPNPFRTSTRIRVPLRAGESARITVLTVGGRLVREYGTSGTGWQTIEWDGRDARGRASPPGVYLIRARIGNRGASGKIVRLR
jgi:hypothetical protein